MDRFTKYCKDKDLPKFRSSQVLQAVYKDLITDYAELTTWPLSMREEISRELPLNTLTELKYSESTDKKTAKVVFKTAKGVLIETVLMRHEDRNTVCVSCMSGCPVGCTFCATGKMGFKGALDGDEIVEQILYFARILKADEEKVTNVVYMGMGEPMLNLANVERSIEVLTSEDGLAMSQRRITISTSGYIPQLKLLREHGFKGRIAISLHAPNQSIREKIMPVVAKAYHLDKLLAELDLLAEMTNKRISYEYILIAGVNTSDECAWELVKLFKHRLAHINLIPYNQIKGGDYKSPSRNKVMRLFDILNNAGIPTTIRVAMGDDISGACGQLAGNVLENEE